MAYISSGITVSAVALVSLLPPLGLCLVLHYQTLLMVLQLPVAHLSCDALSADMATN